MTAALIVVLVIFGLVLALVVRYRKMSRQPILIDGSDVMYWRANTPDIATIRAVVERMEETGFYPGVVIAPDAAVTLFGKTKSDRYFARRLKLSTDRVIVVPEGDDPAGFLLAAARDMNARIVSNRNLRIWGDDYPEIYDDNRLISGGVRDGFLWFDL